MVTQSQFSLIKQIAEELCHPNNTVTTLEIKTELRKRFSNMPWYQSDISDTMNDLYLAGYFEYNDTGSYRVYFIPGTQPVSTVNTNPTAVTAPKVVQVKAAPKRANISKSKALDLIENSGGKFFGVTFIKKDNSKKNMTCRYVSTTSLGYIKVVDLKASKNNGTETIKSVNIQTLTELRTNGNIYKVS